MRVVVDMSTHGPFINATGTGNRGGGGKVGGMKNKKKKKYTYIWYLVLFLTWSQYAQEKKMERCEATEYWYLLR